MFSSGPENIQNSERSGFKVTEKSLQKHPPFMLGSIHPISKFMVRTINFCVILRFQPKNLILCTIQQLQCADA